MITNEKKTSGGKRLTGETDYANDSECSDTASMVSRPFTPVLWRLWKEIIVNTLQCEGTGNTERGQSSPSKFKMRGWHCDTMG